MTASAVIHAVTLVASPGGFPFRLRSPVVPRRPFRLACGRRPVVPPPRRSLSSVRLPWLSLGRLPCVLVALLYHLGHYLGLPWSSALAALLASSLVSSLVVILGVDLGIVLGCRPLLTCSSVWALRTLYGGCTGGNSTPASMAGWGNPALFCRPRTAALAPMVGRPLLSPQVGGRL